MEVLSVLIDVQEVSKDVNIGSIDNKRAVALQLEVKNPNTLNNYIKKFKDKGVLRLKDNNYSLNPFLNPKTDSIEINLVR